MRWVKWMVIALRIRLVGLNGHSHLRLLGKRDLVTMSVDRKYLSGYDLRDLRVDNRACGWVGDILGVFVDVGGEGRGSLLRFSRRV